MNKAAIIAKAAGAFNKVNPLLGGARLLLLKRGVESSRFVIVEEITSGFWSRWSEYRQASVFQWASNDDWTDKVATSSHIGYGVPEDGEIEVFEIAPESRDRTDPNGANLIWKLYGIKILNERFTIPTPDP